MHVSDVVLFLDKRALCHCNADCVYLLVDGKAVPFDASESLSRHKRDKVLLVRKWLTVAYTALRKPDQPYLSADEAMKAVVAMLSSAGVTAKRLGLTE